MELSDVAEFIDREVKNRFPDGAVLRAELLRDHERAGQLVVRVFIPPDDDLTAWTQAHSEPMAGFRHELSLRLPAARLLEFTADRPDAAVYAVPDDGSLANEQPSGREIVATTLGLLRSNYVFPELAEQTAAGIEARLAAGEYDDLDEIALTSLLTEHLQAATNDKHLRVGLGGPTPRRAREEERPDRQTRLAMTRRQGGADNFGIRRVERLEGNVGYVDLRRIAMPENAGPAIAATMELVAGTYALIIDLRRNGGGSPHGVALWCSYLLDEHPVHLNDIFHADSGETNQFWSLPYVPGTRYVDKPVYVLTSNRTFSGGEDLAYTLQAIGRAQVVGETTGGGAHPTRMFPVSAAVHAGIPFARSINPVTGGNWQGTGVRPDTEVPADQAYDVAYRNALRHVRTMSDVPPPVADEARVTLASLETSP